MTTPLKPIRAIDLVPEAIKQDPELTKIAAEVAQSQKDWANKFIARWGHSPEPVSDQAIYDESIYRLIQKRITEYEKSITYLEDLIRKFDEEDE